MRCATSSPTPSTCFPSVLELIGLVPPEMIDSVEQSHIDGISFSYLLGHDGGAEPGRHLTQHFEMFGSRAIYHEGWKAVTFHPVGPLYPDGLNPNAPFDDDVWELYHVEADVSETRDLAQEHPERLQEMIERWWTEAERNDVLPLDNRILWALVHPKPDARRERDRFRYFQDGAQVPESVAVNVRNRSARARGRHHRTRRRGSPGHAAGPRFGPGRVVPPLPGRATPLCPQPVRQGAAPDRIRRGGRAGGTFPRVRLRQGRRTGRGGRLRCDGRIVAEGSIRRFTPQAFNGVGVGLTCGYEWGPAVGNDYVAPDRFNAVIDRAVVETRGPIVRDPMAEIEAILAQQ